MVIPIAPVIPIAMVGRDVEVQPDAIDFAVKFKMTITLSVERTGRNGNREATDAQGHGLMERIYSCALSVWRELALQTEAPQGISIFPTFMVAIIIVTNVHVPNFELGKRQKHAWRRNKAGTDSDHTVTGRGVALGELGSGLG